MLRYYTTPETRAALIAESNRIIAARAAAKASHDEIRHGDFSAGSQWSVWGSMPYATQGPAKPPTYLGLMRFIATNR